MKSRDSSILVKSPDPGLVLRLPELLITVFSHLKDDKATLCNAIRVNSVWFDCGTDVLWGAPPPAALKRVASARRQRYASKIAYLDLGSSDNDESEATFDAVPPSLANHRRHIMFKDLCFSNLKSVVIDSYRQVDGPIYLDQYLQPALEKFELFGADLDAGFLARLNANCPRLREILIDAPGDLITPELFLDFLKGCPSVEQMKFVCGMAHLLTKDVWFHLAARPNLKHLAADGIIQTVLLDGIADKIALPFRALMELQATNAPTQAVLQLVTMIPQLIKLEVLLVDNMHDVLPSLARLSNLRYLDVILFNDTILPASSIVALKSLVSLQVLHLRSADEARLATASNFDEAKLENLVSCLPDLRVLELVFSCPILSPYQVLSQHCKSLEILALDASTLALPDSNPTGPHGVILPKLQELKLETFRRPSNVPHPESRIEEIIEQLRAHFPALIMLFVDQTDKFNQDLFYYWFTMR